MTDQKSRVISAKLHNRRTRTAPLLGALAILFSSAGATAAEIRANGEPITTSSYALDLFQGPLFAGSRVTSLGGADVKLAVWNVFGLWPDNYMWRLGLGGDVSRDYFTWGLTIAGWYPRHKDPASVPDFSAGMTGADSD